MWREKDVAALRVDEAEAASLCGDSLMPLGFAVQMRLLRLGMKRCRLGCRFASPMKSSLLIPCFCRLLLIVVCLQAVHADILIPDGGTEMRCVAKAFANKASGKIEKTDSGWKILVSEAPVSAPSNPEDRIGLRLEFPDQEIQIHERLFCILKVRVQADYGEVSVKLNRADDTKVFLAKRFPVYFGTDWMEVPFVVSSEDSAKPPVITFGMGARPQDVEIGGVRVFRYPAGYEMSRLSFQKMSYLGREADSAWRAVAADRIEKIRKGDLIVHLLDERGQPVLGGSVSAQLERHFFRFGSAVSADLLTAQGEDADRYRALIQRLFSAVVFENDLKPQMYEKRKEKRQMSALDSAVQWLESNHIQLRGHYLFQNAINSTMPQQIRELGMAKYCEKLRASIRGRIEYLGGRACEWDAANHPIAWPSAKLLTQSDGFEAVCEDLMREIATLTSLPLVINEDNLSDLKERQAHATWELLKHYRQAGLRVDKLGHQAHYHLANLISPEAFLKVADYYSEVVPAQLVTEFDVRTNGDDQLAADFTRDMMTAVFSHPAFDGFLSWGFWEGKAHHGECMPWRKDWSARPCGQMLEELLGNTWRTRVNLAVSAEGAVGFRGFYGRYIVRHVSDGKTLEGELELTPSNLEATVRLHPKPQPEGNNR